MFTSLFREIVAGHVFMTCLVLFLVFSVYTWRQYILFRYNGWWKEVRVGLSVTLFALGGSIINGLLWWTRHLYNQDRDTESYVTAYTAICIVGMLIKTFGGLWMVREFTPRLGFASYVYWAAMVLIVMMSVYCYLSYVTKWGFE